MCIKPFSVKIDGKIYTVPCKRCLGCRVSYFQDIMFLSQCEAVHAYESGFGCSFVTLTYADDFVPTGLHPPQIPSWDSPLLSKREVSLFSVFVRPNWKAKGYSLLIVQSFQVILDLLVL